ncbi:gliding motility-associated C-terminal domain-containing protein [Pedobacter aquatilis]|uniref:gliding motility-associated C-terminal domain-containing protein n=1 Tax=Pedobacter aquatilis TaxID=351343 RepID=UPI0025B32978|nr:gliding motility-associated C-terminal domain-containing protein [Pedobacter aquatilis]
MNAQLCPENIDFENSNFKNWKIYSGAISATALSLEDISQSILGRHTIINDKNAVDPYGQFPLIPKSAGNYTVKLGNNGTGGQAEGISYIINVPENRPEFTLTYQYAVVLEDPNHQAIEQPRFIARVKDVETNQYISCASYEYIATANLPGFKKSTASSIVIYKDWTPVTINLSGYQGKQLVLEFITTDCTLGGHFGYAYVDVNGLCGNLIIGNTYCKSSEQLTVSGPSGFKNYNWYNEDRTVKYGTTQSVVIKPTPPDGSKIYLDLVPFTGFGCESTITTTVAKIDYQLQLRPTNTVCEGAVIDILSDNYILNRHPDFSYFAYADKDLTIPVNTPITVNHAATYYVKATNYKGCESVTSTYVDMYDLILTRNNNLAQACYNESVDITKLELYKVGLESTVRSYFTNQEATITLPNPSAVRVTGRYYVKILSNTGCTKIIPIDVLINPKPNLTIANPPIACFPSTVNITEKSLFTGSDVGLVYSFYRDEALTQEVVNPAEITITGTYYVKAINELGCTVSGKIIVDINDPPILSIKNPEEVCYPSTIDITVADLYDGTTHGVRFEYFKDKNLSIKLNQPWKISESGTYYVKIINPNGCFVSDKIVATINKIPVIVLNQPKPIFDHDYIDLTAPEIIKGSKDFIKAKYFTDATLSTPLAEPNKVNKAGIYFISLENDKGCGVSAAITLNILPSPKIFVPTAFTPQKSTNNRLYPFLTSIQKLSSFKVYNKWGLLVYQTNDMSADGWDGQFKSRMQPLETFSWFADGIDVLGGKFQTKGKTILIL